MILLYKFRQRFSLPEQIANVPDFLYKEYKNSKFTSVIPGEAGEDMVSLRKARNILRNVKKDNLKDRTYKSKFEQLKYNFSYEVSLALQNIGLLVLFGALPVELVLPDIAGVIIEDWNQCSESVDKEFRKEVMILKSTKKKKPTKPIHFSRRHGEWLVHAAAVYLHANWKGARVEKHLKMIGNWDRIKEREKELREAEPEISKKTQKKIHNFLYDP